MKSWSLALLALVAACGGDRSSSAPTCDDDRKAFSPCGGDLVGTWTATAACGDAAPSPLAQFPACSGATWKLTDVKASGTVTFTNDGSEHDSFTTAISVSVAMPDGCFKAVFPDQTPGTDACAALQGRLDGAFHASGTCGYVASACSCQVVISNPATGTLNYTIDGTSLKHQIGDPIPYCVSGTSLHARVDGTDGSSTFYELTKN